VPVKVSVRIVPRARREKIEPFGAGLKIHVREPALEGRANERVVELLAEHYGVRRSAVSILLGEKRRDKVVEILGREPA
jgi:uncharacterized protein (TIGR00251 family)